MKTAVRQEFSFEINEFESSLEYVQPMNDMKVFMYFTNGRLVTYDMKEKALHVHHQRIEPDLTQFRMGPLTDNKLWYVTEDPIDLNGTKTYALRVLDLQTLTIDPVWDRPVPSAAVLGGEDRRSDLDKCRNILLEMELKALPESETICTLERADDSTDELVVVLYNRTSKPFFGSKKINYKKNYVTFDLYNPFTFVIFSQEVESQGAEVNLLLWDVKNTEPKPISLKIKTDSTIVNVKELAFPNGDRRLAAFTNEDANGQPKYHLFEPSATNQADICILNNTDERGTFTDHIIQDVVRVYPADTTFLTEVIEEEQTRVLLYDYRNFGEGKGRVIAQFRQDDEANQAFSANGELMIQWPMIFSEVEKEGPGSSLKINFELHFLVPKEILTLYYMLNARGPDGVTFRQHYQNDEELVRQAHAALAEK
eukprot:TRINITY_DN3380_c0_g1_i1.p1 TRINITY_DN3380_c0_g1~~TRINITY_DN3380_c0_g1_i1.p1  ORF type:complete len:425 (+),score=136.16 TRINITY_DN3380_c0_g1_i1:137-1411(+)